jgi:hypothetical protein
MECMYCSFCGFASQLGKRRNVTGILFFLEENSLSFFVVFQENHAREITAGRC